MSQEQEHDQHNESNADRHRYLHLIDRSADGLGAVPHDLQFHRRRKIALKLRQRGFNKLNSLIDVESELLVHVDDDDALAAEPCGLTNAFSSIHSIAKVADPHRRAIAIGNDHGVECRRIEYLVRCIQGQGLPRTIQRAFGGIDGCSRKPRADLFKAQCHCGRHSRIDLDSDRRLLLAVVVDQPYARDAGNTRGEIVLDILVNF